MKIRIRSTNCTNYPFMPQFKEGLFWKTIGRCIGYSTIAEAYDFAVNFYKKNQALKKIESED